MPVSPLGRWFRRPAVPAAVAAEPMFEARSVSAPAAPAPQHDRVVGDASDDATIGRLLDSTGALVQLLGAYAHDTDTRSAREARELAERWRKHLMLGLGHPKSDAEGEEPSAPRGASLPERDFEGAIRYAVGDRRAEHAYVARAASELRDTIWTLISGLHRVADAENVAGRESAGAIHRARVAITAAEPEKMRDVAMSAVGELSAMLAARDREREERIAALGAQIATLGEALEEAKREGSTDALTELGNRRAFDGAIEHAVALHGLWRHPFCLVLFDVDGLKHVNDTLGHAAGDAALAMVARKLSLVFLRRTDVLTRVGGDEFAAVLRETTAIEAARNAFRAAGLVGTTPVLPPSSTPTDPAAESGETDEPESDDPSATVTVGISAGVAELRPDESAAAWYARADAALYVAKRAGRGRIEIAG
jgi:diguanylate cyclase